MKKLLANILLHIGCYCFRKLYHTAVYQSDTNDKVTAITFTNDEKYAQYCQIYKINVVDFPNPDNESECIIGHTTS